MELLSLVARDIAKDSLRYTHAHTHAHFFLYTTVLKYLDTSEYRGKKIHTNKHKYTHAQINTRTNKYRRILVYTYTSNVFNGSNIANVLSSSRIYARAL